MGLFATALTKSVSHLFGFNDSTIQRFVRRIAQLQNSRVVLVLSATDFLSAFQRFMSFTSQGLKRPLERLELGGRQRQGPVAFCRPRRDDRSGRSSSLCWLHGDLTGKISVRNRR